MRAIREIGAPRVAAEISTDESNERCLQIVVTELDNGRPRGE